MIGGMKHFMTVMDIQGQHITLNVYAIEYMRATYERNKYLINMTSDNYHVVDGETYQHICNYLNSQNELHNLINHHHHMNPHHTHKDGKIMKTNVNYKTLIDQLIKYWGWD